MNPKTSTMKKFEFSPKQDDSPIFDAEVYYHAYKNAQFLQQIENIETFLCKGHELRKKLKEVEPGEWVSVGNMKLSKDIPVLIKRTGPNVTVEGFAFTANRLTGFVACYAFDNRSMFSNLKSTEALALGLKWDNRDEKKCRLFLAAVSGTEHFYKQFSFWPLVCGLRKLDLNSITVEPIVKMAKIKNPLGLRMANELMRNLDIVKDLWSYFPGTTNDDLKKQLQSLPPELKKIFFNIK